MYKLNISEKRLFSACGADLFKLQICNSYFFGLFNYGFNSICIGIEMSFLDVYLILKIKNHNSSGL